MQSDCYVMFLVLFLSYYFFEITNDSKRIFFIFPGLIGLMIGIGLIIEATLIIGFLYIAKNSLNYIYDSEVPDGDIDQKEENIK